MICKARAGSECCEGGMNLVSIRIAVSMAVVSRLVYLFKKSQLSAAVVYRILFLGLEKRPFVLSAEYHVTRRRLILK